MQPIKFTATERKAISAAFDAIHHMSETTNWTDAPAFRAAYKACRKESDSQCEAQARIVAPWLAGARAIDADAPISNYPFGYTEYYQRAFRLGCEQALEHSGPNRSDYTGPLYDKARLTLTAIGHPAPNAAANRQDLKGDGQCSVNKSEPRAKSRSSGLPIPPTTTGCGPSWRGPLVSSRR